MSLRLAIVRVLVLILRRWFVVHVRILIAYIAVAVIAARRGQAASAAAEYAVAATGRATSAAWH